MIKKIKDFDKFEKEDVFKTFGFDPKLAIAEKERYQMLQSTTHFKSDTTNNEIEQLLKDLQEDLQADPALKNAFDDCLNRKQINIPLLNESIDTKHIGTSKGFPTSSLTTIFNHLTAIATLEGEFGLTSKSFDRNKRMKFDEFVDAMKVDAADAKKVNAADGKNFPILGKINKIFQNKDFQTPEIAKNILTQKRNIVSLTSLTKIKKTIGEVFDNLKFINSFKIL